MDVLTSAGYKVLALEAAARAGGRIATTMPRGFEQPVELGAEFIHGDLPLTKKLLKKAGIQFIPVEGKMVRVEKGQWKSGNQHEAHWKELLQKLRKQESDITIADFLAENFPGAAYKKLRDAASRFAEGFDLADPANASILGVKDEWLHEEETQYRVAGGYGQLVEYLKQKCLKNGGKIRFNSACTKIGHTGAGVTVYTADGKRYAASKIVVTCPVSVLSSESITFEPALDTARLAIAQLGSGDVIRILLQFSEPFWTKKDKELGFVLSDEVIPTWWTQSPKETNLLTGWLGGPAATKRKKDKDKQLLDDAVKSLSNIFHIPVAALRKLLVAHEIVQWSKVDYIAGGYSYQTLFSAKAIELLNRPFSGTIHFAGEALHDGDSRGTVEAALQSGRKAARRIMSDLKQHKKGLFKIITK